MHHVLLFSHTHWLCFHYETYVGISQNRTPLYCMYTYKLSTLHFSAPLKYLDSRVRKYKRCSFECGNVKYSTRPRNKGRTPYSLDMCCIFHTTRKCVHLLTHAGCFFTMRRMSVSANTALRCTTCIYVVYMLHA